MTDDRHESESSDAEDEPDEAAQGGSDERSDMVAIAPAREDVLTGTAAEEVVPTVVDTAPANAQMERRDGYAEAITAFDRARDAAKRIEEAQSVFVDAMTAVADGMALVAGWGIGSWEDLLKSPVKELVSSDAFAVGREAAWLRDEGFRSSVDELGCLVDIERLLRSSIESDGPTPEYKAELDALWTGDVAVASVTRAEELRQFVELDALEDVVRNLMAFLDPEEQLFRQIGWDDLSVSCYENSRVQETVTVGTIYDSRWPHDTDYEETVDFQLANAESSALASRIFALLATEDGRENLLEAAARFASRAESHVANAQVAAGDAA